MSSKEELTKAKKEAAEEEEDSIALKEVTVQDLNDASISTTSIKTHKPLGFQKTEGELFKREGLPMFKSWTPVYAVLTQEHLKIYKV
jgi:hypothetical protein